MTDVAPLELTPERAEEIINIAVKWGGYAADRMPEAGSEKITAAQSLITLTAQQKIVADTMGPHNVPAYDGILELLAAAGIDGTIPSPPPPVVSPEEVQPIAPTTATPEQAAALTQTVDAAAAALPSAPTPTPPVGEERVDVAPTESAPPATSASPPPPPAPDLPVVELDPQENELWIDAEGGQWRILQTGGGPQVRTMSVTTHEETILPRGFLREPIPEGSQEADLPGMASTPATAPPPAPLPPPIPATPPTPEPPPVAPPALPPGPTAGPAPVRPLAPPPTVDDDEGDPEYRVILDDAEADYRPTGMPVPYDLERQDPFLTEDLTQLGELEQRRLHSHFNALAARARYLYNLEAAKAKAIDRVKRNRLKQVMPAARDTLGKNASLTEVVQLAEQDDAVEPWISRQERHERRADAYLTFFRMYTENVSVLSRDWTMRSDEEAGS